MPEVDLRETRLRANQVESQSASYESSEVCCHVLRMWLAGSCESSEVCCHVLRIMKVHVSLFSLILTPVVQIDVVRIESNRKVPQMN